MRCGRSEKQIMEIRSSRGRLAERSRTRREIIIRRQILGERVSVKQRAMGETRGERGKIDVRER